MNHPPEDDAAARAADRHGVFENLPRRRPALRTPRRDRRRAEFTADEPRQASFDAPEAEEHHEGGARRRVEDLTLSGIGAAADAVVLGLKLIERAYGGVRGTGHRR